MTTVLILGAAAGAILGLSHFKVLALAPLVVLAAAGAIVTEVSNGLEPRQLTIGLFAAVACPQIGYLLGSIRPSKNPKQPGVKSNSTTGSLGQEFLLSNCSHYTQDGIIYTGL